MANRFTAPSFTLEHIATVRDIECFAKYLVEEFSLNFHPDEPFEEYINIDTKAPTFSKEECEIADGLMKECFAICEKEGLDIYDMMGKILEGSAA